jgi:hypothetical protein
VSKLAERGLLARCFGKYSLMQLKKVFRDVALQLRGGGACILLVYSFLGL